MKKLAVALFVFAPAVAYAQSSLPELAVIAFNGGTAARLGLKALGAHGSGYRILTLPSSSPAHTLSYSEKLRAWRELRPWLD